MQASRGTLRTWCQIPLACTTDRLSVVPVGLPCSSNTSNFSSSSSACTVPCTLVMAAAMAGAVALFKSLCRTGANRERGIMAVVANHR